MATSTINSQQLFSELRKDWRTKLAADVGLDQKEEEQAFADIAFTEVQRKAGTLNDPEHRLGFELVYRNEEGNRMVGIYAFRAGETLLFIPAMFLNGEVKGTELLYRDDTKTIVPVEETWIDYIIAQSKKGTGAGMARDETNKAVPDLNFSLMSQPPANKRASVQRKNEYVKALDKIASALERSLDLDKGLLREFLSAHGEISKMAHDRITKEIETNRDFAANVQMCVDESDLCPPELLLHNKKASQRRPDLVLHAGLGGVKNASTATLNRNFWIEDNRVKHANTYDRLTDNIRGTSDAAVYQVILKGGDTARAIVAPDTSSTLYTEPNPAPNGAAGIPSETIPADGDDTRLVVLDVDNGRFTTCHHLPGGVYDSEITDLYDEGVLQKSPESGKFYWIYSKRLHCFYGPCSVDNATNRQDGVTLLELRNADGYVSDTKEVVLNPDYETSDFDKDVLGSDACFIEIPGKWRDDDEDYAEFEELPDVLSQIDATCMFEKGARSVRIVKQADNEFIFQSDPEISPVFDEDQALVYMMGHLGMSERDSTKYLTKASRDKEAGFHIEPLTKAAFRQLLTEPEWSPEYDMIHNAPMGEDRQYTINTTFTNPTREPTPHYGDSMEPLSTKEGIADAQIIHMQPSQIEMMANEMDAPQVFEHGVVGSLVNTYDAIHMTEQYVKKLEQAVDSLGRWLFLFWWKPEDFEKAYGSDVMEELEDAIVSVFKSLGDVTIDLKVKSADAERGTPQEGK